MNTIVADTSPLILLEKLSLLDMTCSRWNMEITEEISIEATRRQELPDAVHIQHLIDRGRIRVKKISTSKLNEFQGIWGLDRGESAALILAQTQKSLLATDDYQAIRMARTLKIPYTTTVFLILTLHEDKLLDGPTVIAKLEALKRYGWIKEDLIEEAKRIAKGG